VSVKVEQSQVSFVIVDLDQWLGKGGEKKFQGWEDIGFEHVAAAGFSGRESHHAVNMDGRLAAKRTDIAEHRAGFHLTVDRDVAKCFPFVVKPGEDRMLKCPDGADLSSLDIFVFCKFRQTGENFISLAENDGISFLRSGLC